MIAMVAFVSNARRNVWSDFIKNVDFLHKQHQYTKNHYAITILYIMGLVLVHGGFGYFLWESSFAYLKDLGIWNSILFSIPVLQLLYLFLQLCTIFAFIQEIRWKARKSILYLNVDCINIRRAKQTYLECLKGIRCFNSIFGYQIVAIFGYWLLLFETICFYLVESKSNGKVIDHRIVYWKVVVINMGYLIFNSLNLFSVVISCDNTTSESLKLMDRCYELQEKFDRSTFEYQELQALAFYAAHNQLRFTAADLFEIRRSSMLALIATSTTYFIALVQFY
ncbi:hypothetical protein GWI33_008574 [Rhynchophorus ferrugineus]|uniref:Gustatory receptor n=1 Tax=Rhynchophorus ferrugineus TaxID=354439 RepID=A0A834IEW4_RHYFE|nr:hypothetical protein GWI33_008574 [Rhynchophorus ferrugineus]